MPAGTSRHGLAVLFLLILSGCASPGQSAEATGFQADLTYSTGGTVHLRYQDTAELRDLDGQWRTVRVLSENYPSDLQSSSVYLLDDNGRVVATAGPCGDEGPDSCDTYTGVNWLYRGMLPPFGIGLRDQGSSIESWGGRQVTTIELHGVKQGKNLVMTADLEDAVIGSYPDGQFTFRGNEQLPVSAQWSTSNYEELDGLPSVMVLERPSLLPAKGSRQEFFPDTSQAMFGTNFSFSDVIEAARQYAASNGAPIAAGSCGVQFVWTPPRINAGLGNDLAPKPGPEAEVAWKAPSGEVRNFHVQTFTDFLDTKSYQVSSGREQVRATPCNEIAASPAPTAGPNEFANRAQTTAAHGTLTRFKWSVGLAGSATTRPVEAGWDLYEFYMEPPDCGGGCRLYQALYEPASGLLENVVGRPDELLKFANPGAVL